LPQIHSLTGDAVEAYLDLSNNGSTPAEHLVVDLTAVGSIRLQELRDGNDKIEVPEIPQPPTPPRIGLGAMFDHTGGPAFRDPLAAMRFNTTRIARNRHEFYWDFDEPKMRSEHCRGECDDFRHGLKDERIKLCLTWDEPNEVAVVGAIKIVASAKNMPAPVEMTVPVRLDVEVGNSEELLRSIVLEDLGVAI
jgi:hypothetical protein